MLFSSGCTQSRMDGPYRSVPFSCGISGTPRSIGLWRASCEGLDVAAVHTGMHADC